MSSILKVDTIQNTGGTTGLTIDSSGRIGMPNQPAFFAIRTTNYSTTTSDAKLIFDTAKLNRGGHYNTSNGRFTVPVDGLYEIAWATIASSEQTVFRYNLFTNGSMNTPDAEELRLDRLEGTSAYGTNGEYCIYKELDAGDYLEIYIKSDVAVSTIYGSTAYAYTYFRGRLIG